MRVSAPSTRCSARSAPHCRLLAHRSCRSSAPQTSPPPCSTAQVAFASSSSGTSSQPRLARRAVVLASLSSHPFAAMAGAATSTKDLLIVGPGVLGAYAGKLWSEHFKGSKVVGQTNTTNNHHRWVPGTKVTQLPAVPKTLVPVLLSAHGTSP